MACADANFYTFATRTAQFLHIAPQKPRRAHARPWIHVDMDRTVPRAAGTVRAARAPASNPHTARQPTTLVPPFHPALCGDRARVSRREGGRCGRERRRERAACAHERLAFCDLWRARRVGREPVRRSKFLRACGALFYTFTLLGGIVHICALLHFYSQIAKFLRYPHPMALSWLTRHACLPWARMRGTHGTRRGRLQSA